MMPSQYCWVSKDFSVAFVALRNFALARGTASGNASSKARGNARGKAKGKAKAKQKQSNYPIISLSHYSLASLNLLPVPPVLPSLPLLPFLNLPPSLALWTCFAYVA